MSKSKSSKDGNLQVVEECDGSEILGRDYWIIRTFQNLLNQEVNIVFIKINKKTETMKPKYWNFQNLNIITRIWIFYLF